MMTNRSAQQGMTLLESLLALMALVTLMTLCATVLQQRCEQAKAVAAARQLKAVSRALRTYVEDHFSELDQKNGVLSIEHLVNQGYYSHYLWKQRNAYQQEHSPEIIQMGEDQFWLLVVTQGGKAIPRRAWRYIGPLLAGPGGYYDSQSKKIIGCHQEWDAKVTDKIKPGHLILAYPLQSPPVNATDALLYRKKIPIHPQRQQMETNLNLQQHAIVFETAQQQGKMSSQGLHFEQTTDTGTHQAMLGFIQSGAEPLPQITLQTPEQHRLQISPTSLQITGPSLSGPRDKAHQRNFFYNNQKKSIIFISHRKAAPAQCGSQLHREWSQLPYHHLASHSSQEKSDRSADFQKAAHNLCKPDKNSPLAPLGRLFIIGNIYQQQSTLFVCGKNTAGSELRPLAYPIYSTPPLDLNDTVNPSDKEIIEEIKITGFKLKNTANKNLQEMTFFIKTLLNELETLHFVLTLEDLIIKAEESKRTTLCDNEKNLISFHKKLKEKKRKYTTFKEFKKNKFYKEILKSDGEYENIHTQMKDKCNYQNINKGFDSFFRYCLNQNLVDSKKQETVASHCNFLRSIILNLQDCLEPKNSPTLEDMKAVLNSDRMKTFLKQCEDFSNLNNGYWMQTVSLLCPSMTTHPDLFEMIATPAAANRLE